MIIISPAKRQDTTCSDRHQEMAGYLDKSRLLISLLASKSEEELTQCLQVSKTIGRQAWEQYQRLESNSHDSRVVAAIDLYQGDVFKYLDVQSLDSGDLEYLQEQLRILSALYGVLKPFDGIWPYRLEMTTKLMEVPLAKYWHEVGRDRLVEEKPQYLFNLASNAYSEMVPDLPQVNRVNIVFQDIDKNGGFKVVAVKAKRMRGRILRYMVKNRVVSPEQLLDFKQDDYALCEAISSPSRLVFRSS